MKTTADVVIVGAGIVGAACAHELANEKFHVLVVDREGIGAGATSAGMGHLVAMDDSEEQFALTRYSQTLWRELSPRLPASVEYETCGTVWVATDAEEMAEVSRKQVYYAQRGVPSEVLDSQGLREAEPALRRPLPGGLRVGSDAVIYPPCAATFLCAAAKEAGAEFLFGKTVTALSSGRVTLEDGTTFTAKVVVNAAGESAQKLTPGLPIRPRKGHLVITDRYPGTIRHQLVELGYLKSAHGSTADSVAFNVQPRATGQVLIGSSRQYGSADREPEPRIVSRMLRRAFEYLPALEQASAIRVWTGFRAATPDKLPLIGPWPGDPSVFLAAGHEGLGITTSLGTAQLVCDSLLGRPPKIPIDPYLPSRQMPGAAHA
jgi:glycine/D-amino acid oxidase-like deaminating enzyme